MFKLIPVYLLVIVSLVSFFPSYVLAQADTLLSINNDVFSVDDYKVWWERYRDSKDQKVDGIASFLEWNLLINEAKEMELDSLPDYRRQVSIFEKARTLVFLKYEEVDSQVDLKDTTLYGKYLSDYIPRRLVSLIECETLESSKKIADLVGELNKTKLFALVEKYPETYFIHPSYWLRPVITPKRFYNILVGLSENDISQPFLLDNGKTGVLFVESQTGANDHDFASNKEIIARNIRKKMELVLTKNLIKRLKKKYDVVVNRQQILEIDLFAPDKDKINDIVISSTRSKVSVGYLVDQCMRDQSFLMAGNRTDKKIQQEVKNKIVDIMISSSLTSWEALERGYENKPPYKWDLNFYKNNRLVQEILKKIYERISINHADVLSFYNNNRTDFSQPEKVEVVMLQDERDKIYKVWTKTLTGSDPLEEAINLGVAISMRPETALPINHFKPKTIKILKSLNDGDISSPYVENGSTQLIKLISRTIGRVEPFDKVKDVIIKMLLQRQKDEKRAAFIESLKKRSVINLNEVTWQKTMSQINQ